MAFKSNSWPKSRKASCRPFACRSTESTNVPSISKITALTIALLLQPRSIPGAKRSSNQCQKTRRTPGGAASFASDKPHSDGPRGRHRDSLVDRLERRLMSFHPRLWPQTSRFDASYSKEMRTACEQVLSIVWATRFGAVISPAAGDVRRLDASANPRKLQPPPFWLRSPPQTMCSVIAWRSATHSPAD
jgi:hypothetical protein